MPKIKKSYIYSIQDSLFGHRDIIGFGTDDFNIKVIDRNLANDIIKKNHYSKKFYNATYIHLGVYEKDNMVGVLQYGYAMNPASCSSVVEGTEMDQYLELNRMWLSDEIETKYPESRAISYSIKYIRRQYPKVKWIQSFADERCGGFGIVYQACTFSYYGEHKSDFWELEGQVYHNIQMTVSKDSKRYAGEAKYLQENKDRAKRLNLRQFRYIKFLDQREKKKCLLKEQPYPKHYN
jgi:adenine modification enzyme